MTLFLPNPFRERPIPLLDSAPHLAPSWAGTWLGRASAHLSVAWTARPIAELESGFLRVEWETRASSSAAAAGHASTGYISTDNEGQGGAKGFKDYPLSARATVLRAYEVLSDLADVRRVVVWGWAGQNPFSVGPEGEAGSAFAEDRARRWRELGEAGFEFGKAEMQTTSSSAPSSRRDHGSRDREEGQSGKGEGQKITDVDFSRIEAIIEQDEKASKKASKGYSDRFDV